MHDVDGAFANWIILHLWQIQLYSLQKKVLHQAFGNDQTHLIVSIKSNIWVFGSWSEAVVLFFCWKFLSK